MIAQIDAKMFRMRPSKVIGRLATYVFFEGRPLLARGRWFNRFVFAGYRMLAILPQVKGITAPIFIVGNGRSGTTILGRLFAMHRRIAYLNEPKALWHYAHGGEDLIGSYSDGEAAFRLSIPENLAQISKRIARIYGWCLILSRGSRIVDKYPELVFRIGFVRALFSDARFVCIMRDGVDVSASITSFSDRKSSSNGNVHAWWGKNSRKWRLLVDQLIPDYADLSFLQDDLRTWTNPFDRAAVEWLLSAREGRKQSAAYPGQVLIVAYEDLCASPRTTMERIQSHCNLENDPVVTAYAEALVGPAPDRGTIALHPSIVGPFRATLQEMGYANSLDRVTTRATSTE